MASFRTVALVQAHQRIQPAQDYYVADLVELCGLAAAVRDAVDDVWLPVSPHDRDPLGTFERFVRRARPALVGISAFTAGARSARDYAAIAKRSGAAVVLGGFHPSALPEEVLDQPEVDAVVRGEGEEALRELVLSGSPAEIAGMSWRRDGAVVHNPLRPPIADLDALPGPLRELRPERFGLAGLDYHTDTVFASRGCRGRCVFCANHLVGRSWRGRSEESILGELLALPSPRRGRVKTVKFWDSNFLSSPERVEALCDRIIELGLQRRFRFIAETRVEDIVRAAPILEKMRAAGIVRIGCGVESPNRSTHRHLRKGINLGHVERAAELLTAARIRFTKFLIVGHPGETEADILAYPEYSLSHGAAMQKSTFFVMTPYPGTDLAAEYERNGWIASRDWDLYTNFGAVVEPGGLSAARLQVLRAAVAIRYDAARRFLEGRTPLAALDRIAEPALLTAMILLQRGEHSREAVAELVMDAFTAAAGTAARSPAAHRRRPGTALAFHLPGRDPVLFAIRRHEDREILSIGPPAPGRHGGTLHLSVPHLVRAAARLDFRALANDAGTLTRSPRAFRLAWAPSLVRSVALVTWFAAAAVGFHVRTAVRDAFARRTGPAAPP